MRRCLVGLAALAVCVAAGAASVAGAGTDDVAIGTVEPSSGPPGTEVAYTLEGTDEAGAQECATSSAYRLELLAPDGTLAATGGGRVTVPAGIAPGDAAIRLVCYVPDATNRRVIYGLCGRFEVTAGEPVPSTGGASVKCPPTPRVVLGQAVIAAERAISKAFNPQLFYPLPE